MASAIAAGRNADESLEGAREMSLIVKADGHRNLGDGCAGSPQLAAGEGDAAAQQVFDHAATKMFLKHLGEINGMDADRTRNVRRGEAFAKVPIKQLACFCQPVREPDI